MQQSKGVILVVEDEPLILIHSRIALEDAGFEVLAAVDADAAIACLAARPDIGTLFTDVQLPGAIDGVALAQRVHAERPDVAIFVTSGREALADDALPGEGRFVPKPYTAAQMCRLMDGAR